MASEFARTDTVIRTGLAILLVGQFAQAVATTLRSTTAEALIRAQPNTNLVPRTGATEGIQFAHAFLAFAFTAARFIPGNTTVICQAFASQAPRTLDALPARASATVVTALLGSTAWRTAGPTDTQFLFQTGTVGSATITVFADLTLPIAAIQDGVTSTAEILAFAHTKFVPVEFTTPPVHFADARLT